MSRAPHFRACALLALLAAPVGSAWAQVDPDLAERERYTRVRTLKVITITGEEIPGGEILLKDDKVEAVGRTVEAPAGTRVLDARDQVVMPGFVVPRARLGLPNYNRGGNQAQQKAADELYPRPGDFQSTLERGITCAGLIPNGSGIPGLAAAVRPIDGGKEAMVLDDAAFLRLSFTSLPRDKAALRGVFAAAEKYIEAEKKAKEGFEKALKAWEAKEKARKAAEAKQKADAAKKKQQGGKTAPSPQPKPGSQAPAKAAKKPVYKAPKLAANLEPFVAMLKGDEDAPRVLMELGGAAEWLHFRDLELEKLEPMLYLPIRGRRGETDLHRVIGELADKQRLIVMAPRLVNEPYTLNQRNLAAALVKAGAKLAFEGAPNLPAAAELVRLGLPREAALKALTLHPAEILGLGDEMGAIAKGRRADLVFLSQDPLAPGAEVERIWIDGREVWSDE